MSHALQAFTHALYLYGHVNAKLALMSNKENFQYPHFQLQHWTKNNIIMGNMEVARTIAAFQRLVAERFRMSGEDKQVRSCLSHFTLAYAELT